MESQLYSGNEEDYNISEFSEEPLYPRYAVNTMSITGQSKLNKNIPKDFGVKFDFSSKKGRPRMKDFHKLLDNDLTKFRLNSANRPSDFRSNEIQKCKVESKKIVAKSMSSGKFDKIEEEDFADDKPSGLQVKKSKFKKFKEKANLKIFVEPIEKRVNTQEQQNLLFALKVNFKESSHENEYRVAKSESQMKQINDVDLYFKNIDEVREFKQIHGSDEECDESDEDVVQVFKAEPNKFRQNKMFNFLSKDIKSTKENNLNAPTPGFSKNPFEFEMPFGQIDSGSTPLFKVKPVKKEAKNENEEYWLDANVKADFDKSERYLYEFFNHKDYYKFKEKYFNYLEQASVLKQSKVKKVSIGEQLNNSKKVIFFEIDKTILLLSEQKIEGLPHFKYIGKELASYFDRNPFYIYLRPFVFGFLNAIKNKFNLAVYSKYNKQLLIFLMDILQEEKEFFSISITHNIKKRTKSIDKFLTEGRSKKNVLLIDTSAKVAACNAMNCIPIPKFKGERLDSNLLYLQKYLLELSDDDDVSKRISKNFYKAFLQRKDEIE